MATAASTSRDLLVEILEHVDTVNGKVNQVMADLSALSTAVDQLVTTDASVVAELQRLSALIAGGGSVSQADIDALTAKVQGVSSDIQSAIAADPA